MHPLLAVTAAVAGLFALPMLRSDVVPDALLGPYGALVGAIVIIFWAGRQLSTFIADLRTQRDLALTGWREQTAATNAVAAAIESRNRADESRLALQQAEEAGRKDSQRARKGA